MLNCEKKLSMTSIIVLNPCKDGIKCSSGYNFVQSLLCFQISTILAIAVFQILIKFSLLISWNRQIIFLSISWLLWTCKGKVLWGFFVLLCKCRQGKGIASFTVSPVELRKGYSQQNQPLVTLGLLILEQGFANVISYWSTSLIKTLL